MCTQPFVFMSNEMCSAIIKRVNGGGERRGGGSRRREGGVAGWWKRGGEGGEEEEEEEEEEVKPGKEWRVEGEARSKRPGGNEYRDGEERI